MDSPALPVKINYTSDGNYKIASRFLQLIDSEAESFTFQTFDDTKQGRKNLARIRHGTLEQHFEELTQLNSEGAGVFVTVNETDGTGRKLDNIRRIRACFQEDDGDGKPLPLEPHIINESSPGKHHRYLLVEGVTVKQFGAVQQALINRYGSDPSVKDAARVLRLPGFYHCKAEPYLARIVHDSGAQPYPAETLLTVFGVGEADLKPRTSAKREDILPGEPLPPVKVAEIQSALNAILADDRPIWVTVGMALKSTGAGRQAFELWDTWSQTSDKYVAEDMAYRWESFHGEGITLSTVFYIANQNGWKWTPPPPAVPAVPPENERPCFRVFEDWVDKRQPGVWFFSIRASRKRDEPPILTEQFVCTPLYVDAVTFDHQENNFGRLLRFRTTLERWREWAMPMELLKGSGDELRGQLFAMGVHIYRESRILFEHYIQAKTPKRRIRCALQVGWCGESFVLPDVVIGPGAGDVIFQSSERGHEEFTQAGTLSGWQAEIAARAVGNPVLTLALSAAFAGPLLARCHTESGGIHLVEDTSKGKSAAIKAACSVWGGPNYMRSWAATVNGMEGAAAMFNDALLALDDSKDTDGATIGAIVYSLANGVGKQRASRTGTARSITRWRCFVLSSGEKTIETSMAESGRRIQGGQAVRLLDIQAGRAFGCWDNLHGFPSGAAFTDELHHVTQLHHGHAGRVFLEKLTHDQRDFCELLGKYKAEHDFHAEEGQHKRAAARLALVALAGELATNYGITGWPGGEAIKAATEALKSWCALRGTVNTVHQQIIETVSGFIDRHGDSRFSSIEVHDEKIPVRDRAGWWRSDENGERIYLFNADGMRESLKGFDFKRALDVLEDLGALPKPGGNGKRARWFRVQGRAVKLYPVTPSMLDGRPIRDFLLDN